MTDVPGGPRVAVCIVTRSRPRSLDAALASLAALEGVAPDVIVVDNDPAGSARPVCERRRVRHVVEAEPGIPFARNCAVEEALAAGADLVAFIDDDEIAAPDWLVRLLAARRTTGAPIVTGPSLPVFPDDAPAWVVKGRFFEPARFPTGHDRDRAYTNNVLVDARVFRDGLRFDERMRMTGGSDTQLFRRARAAGHRIVWVDDAVTSEVVPASRMTVSWICGRGYRLGTTTAFMARDLGGVASGAARMLVSGGYRVLKGVVMLPVTSMLGRARWVWSLRHVAYGWGMIAGTFGVRYDEYEKTHGS